MYVCVCVWISYVGERLSLVGRVSSAGSYQSGGGRASRDHVGVLVSGLQSRLERLPRYRHIYHCNHSSCCIHQQVRTHIPTHRVECIRHMIMISMVVSSKSSSHIAASNLRRARRLEAMTNVCMYLYISWIWNCKKIICFLFFKYIYFHVHYSCTIPRSIGIISSVAKQRCGPKWSIIPT